MRIFKRIYCWLFGHDARWSPDGMGEYPSLEDMEDCAVCEERKDEPTIPLDKALRDLGLD